LGCFSSQYQFLFGSRPVAANEPLTLNNDNWIKMSSMMRDWIGSMVEEELSASLESFKGNPISGGLLQIGNRTWHPNGLTIDLNKRRHVQVLEVNPLTTFVLYSSILIGKQFTGHGSSDHAVISDGTNYIKATFAQAATDSFQKFHGRVFTEHCRGAVITVRSYKLVSSASLLALSFETNKFRFWIRPQHCRAIYSWKSQISNSRAVRDLHRSGSPVIF
jgi:hypothetical protein